MGKSCKTPFKSKERNDDKGDCITYISKNTKFNNKKMHSSVPFHKKLSYMNVFTYTYRINKIQLTVLDGIWSKLWLKFLLLYYCEGTQRVVNILCICVIYWSIYAYFIIMPPFKEVGVYCFAHVSRSIDKPCPINN